MASENLEICVGLMVSDDVLRFGVGDDVPVLQANKVPVSWLSLGYHLVITGLSPIKSSSGPASCTEVSEHWFINKQSRLSLGYHRLSLGYHGTDAGSYDAEQAEAAAVMVTPRAGARTAAPYGRGPERRKEGACCNSDGCNTGCDGGGSACSGHRTGAGLYWLLVAGLVILRGAEPRRRGRRCWGGWRRH